MQPVTRYALSGDVHIAYQVSGEGAVKVVFAPPFVSNVENFWDEPDFARWLLRLASYARVVMFDKRGTGLSDRVAELPDLDQRMDDLLVVMDAAGMEQAALLGISEGGPLCVLFAATYPTRCSALVLVGSFVRARQERAAAILAYIDGVPAAACPNSRPRARMIQPSNAGGAGSNGLARARPPRPPLCA
jgi:pimeloyl-ACP methyl ester carboxylesterase